MNCLLKTITAGALGFITATSSAAATPPRQLITHNTTNTESNAFIDDNIPSQYPTKAHSDSKVFWTVVKMACFGHTVNGKCSALIKMETDTTHPLSIGKVYVDIETGDITPKQLSAHGYTITVNGPGETTLSQDK